MKREIVKVQVPMFSNERNVPAMIYNKDRSKLLYKPIDKEITDLMKGRPKVFAWAEFKENDVHLIMEAPWQAW